MEVTTVKLNKRTKLALDGLKQHNESYDEVIAELISEIKNKNLKKELIEAYKNKIEEDLSILKEWEIASKEVE